MLVLGFLVLGLNGFVILLSGRFSAGIIPGIACVFVSLGYLTRPYFTVHADKVVFHALIGPVKKTRQIANVKIDGERVWLDGKKVAGWIADSSDWKKFVANLPRG